MQGMAPGIHGSSKAPRAGPGAQRGEERGDCSSLHRSVRPYGLPLEECSSLGQAGSSWGELKAEEVRGPEQISKVTRVPSTLCLQRLFWYPLKPFTIADTIPICLTYACNVKIEAVHHHHHPVEMKRVSGIIGGPRRAAGAPATQR